MTTREYLRRKICTVTATVLVLGVPSVGLADRSDTHTSDQKRVEPDNSARNTRDRSAAAITAGDQSLDSTHQEVTRKIREEIVRRDSFSTYAKNIKVVTDDRGEVWLKGPVRTENEKNEIADIARRVAGSDRVHNALEIAPSDAKRG